jgi:hypothetical protein
MLSLQRCREILGQDCSLNDEELETLRNQLYGLADVVTTVLDTHLRQNGSLNSLVVKPRSKNTSKGSRHPSQEKRRFETELALLPEDVRTVILERTSIMEFDGGLARDVAEMAALAEYRGQRYH